MVKRSGLVVSAAGHSVALVLVVLILGEPRLFDTPPSESIAVDLVTPEELEPPADKAEPTREEESVQASAAVQPAREEEQARKESTTEPRAQSQLRSAPAAENAAPPPIEAGPPIPGFVDTRELLALYNMRLPGSDFDAPAMSQAKLTRDEVARFKAELRRCWRLPPGSASSSTRVVLRVAFNPDGSLAAEPMLIEASATRDGPQVMQAAMEAIRRCQPFSVLPRDRYREWKQLDVTFTPQDMGGG